MNQRNNYLFGRDKEMFAYFVMSITFCENRRSVRFFEWGSLCPSWGCLHNSTDVKNEHHHESKRSLMEILRNKSPNVSHFRHSRFAVHRWEIWCASPIHSVTNFTTFYGFFMCDWKDVATDLKESRKVKFCLTFCFTLFNVYLTFGFRGLVWLEIVQFKVLKQLRMQLTLL